MRRPALPALLPPLLALPLLLGFLLTLLAAPARAESECQGDHYRFRVPPGFQPIDVADRKKGQQLKRALGSFDRMFGSVVQAEASFYVKGDPESPDAVLGAMAFELQGELKEALGESFRLDALETSLRSGLEQAEGPFEVGSIRRVPIGARDEALELEVSVDDPRSGKAVTLRMAYAVEDGCIRMLLFQGASGDAATDEPLWRGVVASFRLDGGGGLLDLALRYGPFAAGGLILVGAFFLLARKPRVRRSVGRGRAPARERSSLVSRAADGLPVYGAPDARAGAPGAGGSAGNGGTGAPRPLARATAGGEPAPEVPGRGIPPASPFPEASAPRPATLSRVPLPDLPFTAPGQRAAAALRPEATPAPSASQTPAAGPTAVRPPAARKSGARPPAVRPTPSPFRLPVDSDGVDDLPTDVSRRELRTILGSGAARGPAEGYVPGRMIPRSAGPSPGHADPRDAEPETEVVEAPASGRRDPPA